MAPIVFFFVWNRVVLSSILQENILAWDLFEEEA